MTDKCMKCSQEIKLGKLIEKDGKKFYEKFDLNGAPHVCPTKENKQFQRAPQKPRERFTFEEFITEDGKTRRLYSIQREGFVGELKANETFAQMQQLVWQFRAAEMGNAKTHKEEA